METIRRPGVWTWFSNLLAGGLIGWFAVMGGLDFWRSLQAGRFLNRRGPDVVLEDAPLVFWALSGFYGLAVLLAGGVSIVCLLIALRDLTGKTTS